MRGLLLVVVVVCSLGVSYAQWNFPYQSGVPFAPHSEDAYQNYMFLSQLGGNPVESQTPLVDPYDEEDGSFNQYLLYGGDDGGMAAGITPELYQLYTQYSNPAAQHLGYSLFSPQKAASTAGYNQQNYEKSLWGNNMKMYWLSQYFQGARQPGTALDTSMLNSYMLMQSMYGGMNPYIAYNHYYNQAGANKKRKRRSADKKRKRRSAGKRKRRSAGKR
eukprot:GFUD01014500.1.p1 GENE.GFUD01014500.1~~GFUD01014500.1.p1  ORF type:complete len:218 (-),score=35.17 GFUD01014500.1:132-785(-)